ncbi:protein kinase domain-containing protein [Beauveria bassiana ARSEF 2860]|uniref:Protein kinase domain-containing protein n=1 Tax=Beauveria bassiana (strain ARSEF 2860) TaxID=655819 RepID=J5J2V5_BEAB2|nr:protein kinase domain-containing protein [Beauveria bassiana ARSEF 2860]EJP61143.1 protein kinase domain-containing protein [Beauveria bassiana ARSEF 2860]
MEELKDGIDRIYFGNENFEGDHFVPEAALLDLVCESLVKQSLLEIQTPAQEIVYLTDSILRGARKCFAILVLIGRSAAISRFFQRDFLQRSCPDDRLPYTSETLQRIFEKETTCLTVKRFLEKQWMFVIPVLQPHMISRTLDKGIILPFLSEEAAGRGSMGTAWKMKLHPDCHQLPLDGDIVIRKQIECGRDGDMAIFEKELENLSLLTHLNHPNIVQLYCSYMYRDRYNLIFAFADGGSLTDLLNGKDDTKGPEGSQLWLAFANLASAIDALHNFTSELLDLNLSGCHHDLAPRNILIHGKTFLLADFGLSSFRSADEDSLTTFKEVRGSYVAPECQTLDDNQIKSEKVNRASDIWSFGCILSEVLTHSILGPNGVEQFRSKRKVQVASGIEWFRFHCGPGRPNPGVECWLENLQADAGPVSARLVDLVREMLSIEPSQRPNSARVLTILRAISILSFASAVNAALDNFPDTTRKSIDRMLDEMRFRSWYFAFHRLLDELHQSKLDKLELDFSKTIQALEELHYISEGSIGAGQPRRRTFLQYYHSRLLEALPPHYRSFAKERMVELVLESEDVTQLHGLSEAVTDAGDEDIGTLVAVKRLTIMSNDGSLIEDKDLILDENDVNLSVDIDIHSCAVLQNTSDKVLVEWLRYRDVWADEEIGKELRRRLSSVVSLLHAESTARIPGSLFCKGIFHDPSRHAFGVVYDIPNTGMPVTLHQLLKAPKGMYRPLLEQRFRLAADICRCIYKFHQVGRLHRNLHSMNVLFFPREKTENAKWATEPRILGFASSRENDSDAFTCGPDDIGQLRNYQHPEYLAHRDRYREEFDYYSVGMILLEIGLWNTLSKITESPRFQNTSDEKFCTEVIRSRVSQLGVAMGTSYMEAALACVEGGISDGPGPSLWVERRGCRWFKMAVIDRIPVMK